MDLKDIKKLKEDYSVKGEPPTSRGLNGLSYTYDRYLNLSKEVSVWRKISLIFALISVISIGGFVYKSNSSQYIPYAIEINQENGKVLDSKIINNTFEIGEREKEYFITDFIRNLRSVYKDKNFYSQNLNKVYAFLNDNSFNKINLFLKNNTDTVETLRNGGTINVDIESFLKIDTNKYQVNWVEKIYDSNGNLQDTKKYTMVLLIDKIPKITEDMIRTNPLGIIIKDVEVKNVKIIK